MYGYLGGINIHRWQAGLYVLLGASCYGTLSTITKLSFLDGFSVAEISSSHVMVGCFLLWLCSIPVIKHLRSSSPATLIITLLSGCTWGLTDIFYTITISKIEASLAVVLLFQFTWMSQLIHMVQQKTGLTIQRGLSLICILLGTVGAAGVQSTDWSQWNPAGVFFGLCSALSYTLSFFVSNTVGLQLHPLLRSSLMVTGQMMFVLIIFPPIFLFTSALQDGLWMWAGLLGILGIVVTTFSYNKGIPYLGVGATGIVSSIELPMVIVLATLILQEQVSIMQWMGISLILLGIVISEIKR